MSLQDKVKKIVPHFVTSNSDNYYAIRDKITDESATEYINKVLDAAMQAIIDCEGRESKFNHIEAIGKLRPES